MSDMHRDRPRLRIVSSITLAASPPKLSDWADENLEVTVEIPTYETLYRTVFEDLGGTMAARRDEDTQRTGRSRR